MMGQEIIKNHFKARDEKIFHVMETMDFNAWLDPREKISHEKYFQALCRMIIGQQLSGKAAKTIYKRFEELLGEKGIKPEYIVKIKDEELRKVGLSWAKARYVKDLAQKVMDCEVDLDKLDELTDHQVVNELTKIKGIGKWTAEMFLMFSLHRDDIFSFGDLGLKNGIKKVYGLKNPTDKQIEKIIKKWSPYKTYGSIALWHSLE